MSSDSVTVAFEIILEEIGSVVSEVNSQGAGFIHNSDYPRTREAIGTGEKLAAFRKKLESLKEEWVSGFDEVTRSQVHVETVDVSRTIASGSKVPKTVLIVKFPDGEVIYERKASETFALAIKKLGFQRVIDLGIKVNNFPLVSKEKADEKYNQTEIDSFRIMTHSNTEFKRELLLKLGRALNVDINVNIVPL